MQAFPCGSYHYNLALPLQVFCERKYLILRSKREAVERELGVNRLEMNDSVQIAPDAGAMEMLELAEAVEPEGLDTQVWSLYSGHSCPACAAQQVAFS
jgi:hypothetical protein